MKSILLIRRVTGASMEPTLKNGQIILASGALAWRVNDIVVLSHDGREKIKRINKLKNGNVFVTGDNASASTDSREFGWLPEKAIIAKVIWPRRRTIKV